jgi:hypothetical protein
MERNGDAGTGDTENTDRPVTASPHHPISSSPLPIPTSPRLSPPVARRWTIQYTVLTLAIFIPLLWSFRYVRNLYPFTVWNVMMASGDLQTGRNYCVLRGETVSGETIDIRAVHLTNALYARNWTMVNATIDNQSFKLQSIHPANLDLLQKSPEGIKIGERVPDLLAAWGNLYNEQLPTSSPRRLKAIRLDMYRWASGSYSNYSTFVTSWRKEL